MSISFLASIHDYYNQGGNSRLLGLSKSKRYRAFRKSALQNYNLYKDISSAIVYPSSDADATAIFFGFDSNLFTVPDFAGKYVQITNRKGSGNSQEVDKLSAYSFNNIPQSMLMVGPNRSGFEVRLSFRDLFLSKWNAFLDDALRGSEARRNGNPTLTWEMWPSNISHLSSSSRYLKIHQKLRVELDWWPDYDASITYHLYLYLNGSGKIGGRVERWAYWVESGIKASDIGDALRPEVIDGMGSLNAELDQEFSTYSGFTFQDLYYLPGNQTSRPPNGVQVGMTSDDTTIVLVV